MTALLRAGVSGWKAGLSFPNATTTGPAAGGYTDLTPVTISSSPTITTSNVSSFDWIQVLEGGGYLIEGCDFTLENGNSIISELPDATFQGCQVTGGYSSNGIQLGTTTSGTAFYYCAFSGLDGGEGKLANGVFNSTGPGAESGIIIDHCDFRWCRSCVQIFFDDMTITNNYFHDMGLNAQDHVDCLIIGSSSVNLTGFTLTGNTLLNQLTQTSCISVTEGINDMTVQGNLIAGGGYTIYSGYGPGTLSNNVWTGNWFSTMYYPQGGYVGVIDNGPNLNFTENGNMWADNYWYDGPNAGTLVSY
jgi:hypothetical protein